MENNKKGTVKWIIGLCVVAVVAIVGWTTTANLAIRMRSYEEIKKDAAEIKANIMANNVRVSVLETKYDTIQVTLTEIKLEQRDGMDEIKTLFKEHIRSGR